MDDDVVPAVVVLPFAGSGMRVGVFATVRVCLCTVGMFNGSTFIGGNDNGAMEGCEARFPGSVCFFKDPVTKILPF